MLLFVYFFLNFPLKLPEEGVKWTTHEEIEKEKEKATNKNINYYYSEDEEDNKSEDLNIKYIQMEEKCKFFFRLNKKIKEYFLNV
jgi:hypothetical protein